MSTRAIDCEMVVVAGAQKVLARIVIVDECHHVVYDQLVDPGCPVIDYRTSVTGLHARDFIAARDRQQVSTEVQAQLAGCRIVGHSLFNDFDALGFHPPAEFVRDTQTYRPFQRAARTPVMSLSHLCDIYLKVNLKALRNQRGGVHDPKEDAVMAMRLYQKASQEWEAMVASGDYKYSDATSRNDVRHYVQARNRT